MMAEREANDADDAMRVAANKLTMKLYSTVMDVISNDEKKPRPPLLPGDNRGLIAQKLREGYEFRGGVCAQCVSPLMYGKGQISCVICKSRQSTLGSKSLESSCIVTALQSPTGSDLSKEEREKDKNVSNVLVEFYERRSNAKLAYTAKLLKGYQMHAQVCSVCDMPMMKYEDSVDCVICPPKVTEVAKIDTTFVESPLEMTQLTPAEIIVQRLRGAPPNTEKFESELDKAENELLKVMQNDSFGEAIQAFFAKKKAERTDEKKNQEVSDGVVNEGTKGVSHIMSEAAAAQVDEESEHRNADWSPMIPATSQYVFNTPPSVPVTPTIQSTASCSFGDSLFLPWKRMFASACDHMKEDKEPNLCAPIPKKRNDSNEAKERIARLVKEGWVVSSESCPKCNLLLFSMKGQTMVEMQRCALCGLITDDKDTTMMLNRIMEGLAINEDIQCRTSQLPTMLNPRPSRAHCIVDGMLPRSESTFDTVDPGLHDLDMNALLKMLNASSLHDVTRFNAKELMKNELKGEAEYEYNYVNTLPDPTTSHIDPEPLGLYDRTRSRHVSEPLVNYYGKASMGSSPRAMFIDPVRGSENIHYTSNGPTRASQAYGYKLSEPTPNMKAIRNKMFTPDYVIRGNHKKKHQANKAMDAPEHK